MAAPREARTVRLAAVRGQGLFEAPNPFGSITGPGGMQSSYIFDSLLGRDSTIDPIPWLAERWESTGDGAEWAFHLRPGVKFQDGQPLTAQDVEFSYQYLQANPTNMSSSVDVVKEAKALDEGTVRITLKQPYAPFLRNVAASIQIIPKHVWANVKDPKKFNEPQAFMGSGPYRLAGMNETDSSFLFVANETFWLGKPYVQRLEFISVGDELVALKAGKLDAALPLPSRALPAEALAPFRSDPKFSILEARGEGTTALHFNLSKGAPYNDVLFRRAVFHAIDRQELVSRVLGGGGEAGSPGFLAPANPYYTVDVEQYPYDLQKAKSLLDQGGYAERDGQRYRPDGSPLAFSLLFPSNSVRTAEMIRDMLAMVGIKVEMRSIDQGTANQLQGAGNYEVSLITYGGLGGDPDFLRRVYGSPEQAKLWYKAWGYNNPDFAKMAAEQLHTMDENRRRTLIEEMQRVVSRDVPMMPMYYPTRYVIYDPRALDAWYFTPLSNPLAMNRHCFVTGQRTGIAIRQD